MIDETNTISQHDNLNNIMSDMFGIRGVLNKIKASIFKYMINEIKNHFGIVMNYVGIYNIIEMCNVLEKLFPNANLKKIRLNCDSVHSINNTSFKTIKLCKGTYLFIFIYGLDTDLTTYAKLYFFGKKSHLYHKMYKSCSSKQLIEVCTPKMNNYCINYNYSTINGRRFNTIYFSDSTCKEIKCFIDNWLSRKNIYKQRGICYKTGILLHGAPGTGKSTIAVAIATYLNSSIICINPSIIKENVPELSSSIQSYTVNGTRQVVVLLDEFDQIFSITDNEKRLEYIRSILLLLDSPQSPSNALFIATTNTSPEKLKEISGALIRKGRFDRLFEIKGIDKNHTSTILKMCKSFGLSNDQSHKIINELDFSKGPIAQSDIQSKILNEMD